MELKAANITFLINRENTTIELHDKTSGVVFAKIVLSPEQLSAALSRIAYTPCKISVFNIEKLNKKMIVSEIEFPFNFEGSFEEKKIAAIKESNRHLQELEEGWISDECFSSQRSFFKKDETHYVRVTIRKWVDE